MDDRQNIEYEGHENQEMGICYATSKDGFSWDKPDLNLVNFNDNKSNNIIFRGPHGSGIFYDERKQPPMMQDISLYFRVLKRAILRMV